MIRPGLLLIASLAALTASAARARAELVCDEPVITLGTVKAGKPLCQRFTVTNRSKEAVEIHTVQPSCGCLKPRLDDRRLRPGQSAVLLLDVNTLTAPPGPSAWRVQLLYTSEGKPQDLTLMLRATVVTEITIQPAALVLQTESGLSHEITLTDARATPITVTKLRTTMPGLRATLRDAGRDANGHQVLGVNVVVQADFPVGRHDESLQIFTSDPEYPELRVPVTVVKQSRSAVLATPAEVNLPAGNGPLPARVVLLRCGDGQNVEIESATCDNPGVRCTHANGPGSMATLRLLVDRAKVTDDGLHATVTVRLARPAGETVSVPVHCAGR